MGDDATQCIIATQQVVLNGCRDLLKYNALRVKDLQNLQHVYVLVQDVLRYHSGDQQTLTDPAL